MFFINYYFISLFIIEFLIENMANDVSIGVNQQSVPIVINTWGFTNATQKGKHNITLH
jgi:hypothetical protein